MFSRFFIERPRFAAVLSIVIVLAGVLAGQRLPVAQFPDVTPPVVQVQAVFPGANAEVVESTVATPIEEEVNGVDGLLYLTSSSANNGTMSLAATFEVGTDPDIAQVNVQNRVALAEPRLPEEVRRQGISVRKQSTDILLFMNLYSPGGEVENLFLSNYALIHLRDPLLRVPGVGDVRIFGSQRYSMRVWLDPARLAGLELVPADVVAALREQNVQVAAGRVGEPPAPPEQQFTYTLRTQGRLEDVSQFEAIIVRANPDGSFVRLGDVARVELGAQSYDSFAELDGRPSTTMAVYLQPGANAVAAAAGVRSAMDRLAADLPAGVAFEVTYDTTLFVRESLREMAVTVAIATALVVAVVFLFLGSARATLVPLATVPVSLIGALLALSLLGYSLNTVTLFGLILAVGLVVDDAIVVVENVQRLIGEGYEPHEAAIRSMEEVTGPIVATTLVLLAVFVPVGSLPGITGELYRQFAVAISAAVVFSSLNALTLSPALCALLLRPDTGGRRWGPLALFEAFFERARRRYRWTVVALLRRAGLVVAAWLALVAAAGLGYRALPSAFLPDEDQGYFFVNAQLPEGAALPRTAEVQDEIRAILEDTPGVESLVQVGGFNIVGGTSATNAGMTVVILEPWDERPPLQEILGAAQRRFHAIQQADVFSFNPPAIRGLGRTGGFDFRLQDASGGTPGDLAAALRALVLRANEAPEIASAFSTFQADVPQVFVDVDREKSKTLGVPLGDVFGTLQAQLGGLYVNDFNKFGRVYQVRVQADRAFRSQPEDVDRLYVRNAGGQMVPLSTLVQLRATLGPESVDRYNLFRSAQVSGQAAPGFSSSDAVAAMEAAAETLPPGMTYEWSGITLQELRVGNQAVVLLVLALVFVYLFLVAQYESWTLPLAVLLTVPLALAGAVAALALRGLASDVYAQIGLVMLVGLAAKNAILVVEFASQRRRAGRSIARASVTAAHLRLRAVMMTALSFVLGVMPLVLASGAGAASRHSVGTPVFGGMIAASFAGTLAAPILYAVVQSLAERVRPDGR